MMAEKLSDEILGRDPLPRIDANIWQGTELENMQP